MTAGRRRSAIHRATHATNGRIDMALLHKRTWLGQALKDAGDALPNAVTSALGDVRLRPPKAVATGATAALALTAGSAAVSALRRRSGEPRSDR
jgi:hypothetical protein